MKGKSLMLSSLLVACSNQPVKLVKCPRLEINNGTEYSCQTQLSEEEGILQLRELARHADIEEAWMFLPEKRRWVEVGMYGTQVGVIPYSIRVQELLEDNEQSICYHIHPSHTEMFSKNFNKVRKAVSRVPIPGFANAFMQLVMENHEELMMAPSIMDIDALAKTTFYAQKFHTKADMSCKIVSEYGITSFQLTEEAKNMEWDVFTQGINSDYEQKELISEGGNPLLQFRAKGYASFAEYFSNPYVTVSTERFE